MKKETKYKGSLKEDKIIIKGKKIPLLDFLKEKNKKLLREESWFLKTKNPKED